MSLSQLLFEMFFFRKDNVPIFVVFGKCPTIKLVIVLRVIVVLSLAINFLLQTPTLNLPLRIVTLPKIYKLESRTLTWRSTSFHVRYDIVVF